MTAIDSIDTNAAKKAKNVLYRVRQQMETMRDDCATAMAAISTASADLVAARDAQTPDWSDVTAVVADLDAIASDLVAQIDATDVEIVKLKEKAA